MITTTYLVQAGDTLGAIAKAHNKSLKDLMRINPQIPEPNNILVGQPINVPATRAVPTPSWFLIAKNEVGTEEVSGSEHNERIVAYHQTTTLMAGDDETPWCSSFVNWCMMRSNIEGTNSAAARSWLNWGQSLRQPTMGCIVVLQRGRHPWQGHVGFYAGSQSESSILLLGGNQRNRVSIAAYKVDKVLGYRWPNLLPVA